MTDRFENWLEPRDDKTRAWLVSLSLARPAMLAREPPDVFDAQWYCAQLVYLTRVLRESPTVLSYADMTFQCMDSVTNFVGGEAVHMADRVCRLTLERARDWDDASTDTATRMALLARSIAALNGALSVAESWVDVPGDMGRRVRHRAQSALNSVRALAFWLYSRRDEAVIGGLSKLQKDSSEAMLVHRFACLRSAELLAPVDLQASRVGWAGQLTAKRLLAQAWVAHVQKKHKAAAAFFREVGRLGLEHDRPELARVGEYTLREAEAEVPRTDNCKQQFVNGFPIPCGLRNQVEVWAPVLNQMN